METTLIIQPKPGNRKGRKNYSFEFKQRIAIIADEARLSVSELAVANGISKSTIYQWRRELHEGLLSDTASSKPTLLPVVLTDLSVSEVPTKAGAACVPHRPFEPIEIILADAVIRVRVGADVGLLKTIIQSLRS